MHVGVASCSLLVVGCSLKEVGVGKYESGKVGKWDGVRVARRW